MSKLNISRLTNENEDGAPYISGITTFSSTAFLDPPKGNTAQRPEYVQPGMIRFNTDGAHLEYYNGVEWTEVLVANNSLDGGARMVIGGGRLSAPAAGTYVNTIDYITISSTGNATDFGDLTVTRAVTGAVSSSTRGIFSGGYNPVVNTIDYITISSTGNAVSFGTELTTRYINAGVSNATRGLFAGGQNPSGNAINVIEYLTIASTGNTVDFGDLTAAKETPKGCSSSTRGVFAGGGDPNSGPYRNTIEYVTISTLGNAVNFGSLTQARTSHGSCSNSIRGLFGGGDIPAARTNTIDFITIATLGDATDFGDLTEARGHSIASGSSSTRGVFAGGRIASPTTGTNTIDYVTILSAGNAIDFGDLTQIRWVCAGLSNGHGGL
jgi:hypothetical protein